MASSKKLSFPVLTLHLYSKPDASSSNEAVHLQQRLKSLSTELVTLRNRLHVTGSTANGALPSNGIALPGCANDRPEVRLRHAAAQIHRDLHESCGGLCWLH